MVVNNLSNVHQRSSGHSESYCHSPLTDEKCSASSSTGPSNAQPTFSRFRIPAAETHCSRLSSQHPRRAWDPETPNRLVASKLAREKRLEAKRQAKQVAGSQSWTSQPDRLPESRVVSVHVRTCGPKEDSALPSPSSDRPGA